MSNVDEWTLKTMPRLKTHSSSGEIYFKFTDDVHTWPFNIAVALITVSDTYTAFERREGSEYHVKGFDLMRHGCSKYVVPVPHASIQTKGMQAAIKSIHNKAMR